MPAKTMSDYFMDSSNNISFFFEENAFDEEIHLKQPKSLSINKAGHALHDLDPIFREFSRSARMKALVASLSFKRPLPIQSMYIFKQPGIGGEVAPHQDSTFLYTEPHSTTGVWIALEDVNKGNGCLWALPGSHKALRIHHQNLDMLTVSTLLRVMERHIQKKTGCNATQIVHLSPCMCSKCKMDK